MADKAGGILATIKDLITRTKGLDDVHDDLVTVDTVVDGVKSKTDNLPADTSAVLSTIQADLDSTAQYKATGFATPTNVSTAESNIRGADSDTLKTLSDQIDGVGGGDATAANQTTIINNVDKIPKSDGSVVWNATAQSTIQTKAAAALTAYDPPTRGEATSDKNEILAGQGGSPVSSASATVTGTIKEDTSTATPKISVITSPSGANSFGSWVIHDSAVSTTSWIFAITVDCEETSAFNHVIELGTGASPATKIRFSGRLGALNADICLVYTLPIPIKVASGTRLSLRASDSRTNGALTYNMSIQMYQGLET